MTNTFSKPKYYLNGIVKKIKVRPSVKCYEQMRQRIQKEADAIVVDWEDFIKTLDA